MVGRTKLYRSIRSPLIHGHTSARRRLWPWVMIVLIVVAAGVWAYVSYLR